MGLSLPGRLLIVSNRLPVTVCGNGDDVEIVPAAGGLATGLRAPHAESGGLWFGWPGDTSGLSASLRGEVERRMTEQHIVPIDLSRSDIAGYYEGFSNEVLWPLFHYLLDRVPIDSGNWMAYRDTNRKFAEAVAGRWRPGDRVWVHDYHLCLVPALLRELIPEARIGFFLHIPFPSAEVFRILPWRDVVLRGLLGSDLIGLHTFSYCRHLMHSLREILGLETEVDRVDVDGRIVRLGAFPMGVDAAAFQDLAASPRVTLAARLRRQRGAGKTIILSVDRLDYTKGIQRKLLAIERLLETSPGLRGSLRFVQIAVPSRESIPEYRGYRESVERLVGRINGAYSTVDSAPIHYLYRSITNQSLVSLYLGCDIMLVTPLRDGMNLVAKEFVASRYDEDGVLILSEFAGAASELGEALRVNAYDVDGIAEAIRRALAMSRGERRVRMRALRTRVRKGDVHAWVSTFLDALDEGVAARPPRKGESRAEFGNLTLSLAASPVLTLLLDYDGTLVPLADAPDLAAPDGDLRELLVALAARAGTTVHVISGRTRECLEDWLSPLPLWLWAEHGYWSRRSPDRPWIPLFENLPDWKDKIQPILAQFADRTPGALVEEKTTALAWHYRMADPEFGEMQARRLRAHLAEALHGLPLEVLPGGKVVEVRVHGVNKGRITEALPEELRLERPIVAIGDDTTDEDLFASLPPTACTIHVGTGGSRARHRLPDVRAVRAFLRSLISG